MILSGCDGIHAILTCMKDSDILVREVALQAISSIAGQDPSISVLIISSGKNLNSFKTNIPSDLKYK